MAGRRTHYGPYAIVAPLGAGGMGEVYRAHDPRLRRDVAIKILPPQRLDDPESVARLARESRLVAALAHPAIVTIHDVGEEDGRFYFVTELLDGETLRERLGRGRLPIGEALDFAAAIASALAAAHARGIVHRDLKPENLMCVAAGGVKVLDFGIAKVVASSDAQTEAAATFVTQGGAIIGTPAYMAPEQLDGRAIDHRTDQFAFGAVLYEMLAGRRPFAGATPAEVSASILRDEPAHLTAVRGDIPTPLARIVARCLDKNPEQRYASTADLAHAVADVRTDLRTPTATVPLPPGRGRRLVWLGALAVIVAIAGGVMFVRPREPAAMPAEGIGRTTAVAVMPFATIGDGEAYFADGITEAVTRQLGHIDGAKVVASHSAFAYRGRTEGFRQIGRELGVELMVRGSVQRAADRIRISAALVNTVDDATLWSEQYERASADVLSVQDDIAWQVAARLAGTLGRPAPARPSVTPRTTPAAYEAFLRGIAHMRGSASGFAQGISELERAVALDPAFALARARLASAYTQQFFYNASEPALERKAFVEIEQALAINPDLAEAYLARAQLMWNLRNGFPHERAIADVKRAIASNPSLAEAHIELGKLYFHIGLIDESIVANEEALRLDPRASPPLQRLIGAKIDGGRGAELADELARSPQWPLRSRSAVLSDLGRTDEAITAILPRGATNEEIHKAEMNEVALLAQLFARSNRRADAQRALAAAIPLAANPTGLSDTHHAQFAIGCAYALLGKSDQALEWVTRAANEGYPSYRRFSREPDLKSLAAHPGFLKLLERLRQDHGRWRRSL